MLNLNQKRIWRQADKYRVPRMAFVNKMDRQGSDFFMVCRQVKEMLGGNPVALQVPIGDESDFRGVVDLISKKAIVWNEDDMGMTYDEIEIPADLIDVVNEKRAELIEAVAEYDDTLMEKFFEDENSISEDEIIAALRAATIDMSIIPMMCGSAFKNKGVQAMLDAVMRYLPSPLDVEGIEGINPDTGDSDMRKPSMDEPFAALAFKIATDPFVGTLTFFRVYSGVMESGSYVYNSVKGKKERIGRLMEMHANERNDVKMCRAGDIIAVAGLKDTTTGDTLCDTDKPIVLERMEFPDPVISIAVKPKDKGGSEKMGIAIGKMIAEDPSFRVEN